MIRNPRLLLAASILLSVSAALLRADLPGANSRAGGASGRAAGADAAVAEEVILNVQANIDGSDVMAISAKGATWTHKNWDWPSDVKVNGIEWDPRVRDLHADGPLLFLQQVDFSTAKVLERGGRDIIAMEKTETGLSIYFADCPNDAAPYTIKISMLKRRAGA